MRKCCFSLWHTPLTEIIDAFLLFDNNLDVGVFLNGFGSDPFEQCTMTPLLSSALCTVRDALGEIFRTLHHEKLQLDLINSFVVLWMALI